MERIQHLLNAFFSEGKHRKGQKHGIKLFSNRRKTALYVGQ